VTGRRRRRPLTERRGLLLERHFFPGALAVLQRTKKEEKGTGQNILNVYFDGVNGGPSSIIVTNAGRVAPCERRELLCLLCYKPLGSRRLGDVRDEAITQNASPPPRGTPSAADCGPNFHFWKAS